MEKYLGLEYEDLAEREQYIKDNADSIENMGYSKPIPSDQIEKLKETLADASIKKLEQEELKKAAVQMYNEEIKGYKLTIKDAADKLKSKSTYVKEPCYKLIEHQETGRILFFTDTYAMPYDFPNITHFMAEANYSDEILDHNVLEGYIPAALRRRVITSHMSIDNTIGILKRHDLTKTKDILLIHLSDGNSNEKEFITKVRRATGKTTRAASPGMELDFDKGFIDI